MSKEEIKTVLTPSQLKKQLKRIMKLYYSDGRMIGDDILQQTDDFIESICERSKQDKSFNTLVNKWFFNGSTLRLRDSILNKVGFEFKDRVQFNAFASMDAARLLNYEHIISMNNLY